MKRCSNCKHGSDYAGARQQLCRTCPIIDLETLSTSYCNWEPDAETAIRIDYAVDVLLGKNKEVDLVNEPPHYQSETGLEVIDVIKAFTSELKGIEATDTGNIIKYVCRWKKKNGIQDLEKAKWYLEQLIEQVKKGEK